MFHGKTRRHYRGWVLLSFMVLEASVLLDFLTIYGTRILWPFDTTPLDILPFRLWAGMWS